MGPKAFISYSWDTVEHKNWVRELSAQLRGDGVETILDQWHVVPGDQLAEFMEREISNNDYTLIICTPEYKKKADIRSGGVGYEGNIMTAEVFNRGNHKKFIPILAIGKWVDSAPSWLVGKYYIDLSSTEIYKQGYNDLITTIHGHRLKAPPVGNKPNYVEIKKDIVHTTSNPTPLPTGYRRFRVYVLYANKINKISQADIPENMPWSQISNGFCVGFDVPQNPDEYKFLNVEQGLWISLSSTAKELGSDSIALVHVDFAKLYNQDAATIVAILHAVRAS